MPLICGISDLTGIAGLSLRFDDPSWGLNPLFLRIFDVPLIRGTQKRIVIPDDGGKATFSFGFREFHVGKAYLHWRGGAAGRRGEELSAD